MKIIVCVDNNMGMTFGGRRQSRDRLLCEDILSFAKGNLCIDKYSETLFPDLDGIKITDIETYEGSPDEYIFTEKTLPSRLRGHFSEVIVYHWNRDYPADLFFDIDRGALGTLAETYEFKGYSHDKITRERYVK